MFELIETTEQLQLFIEKIGDVNWIALDTEFLRERTYYAKLCLIQLEANGHRSCIDPLKISDLEPLIKLLNDKSIIKVFHAAHQDLEILMQLSGNVPAPIFDTQVAAAVLGYGDQMGYARLIEHMLNTPLSKTQSRTDWTRRPLKQSQLEYAIDDVRYLAQIYPMMLDELQSKNRLNWLDNDFLNASNPLTYAVNANERWKKVRGNQVLNRPQLAILRELAAWREQAAEKANRPRKWMLSDDILLDLSRQQPSNPNEVLEVRGLQTEKTKKYHKTWLELIAKGKQTIEEEWPELPRSKKPTVEKNILIDLLMVVIQVQAKKHGITPSVIATRKHVTKMVQSDLNTLSDDWRGELVNQQFIDLISGKIALGIEGNKATIMKF